MRRWGVLVGFVLAVSTLWGFARAAQQPPAGPAPVEDRVGFPEGYEGWTVLYVYDRPDNKQVRVIYGNDKAVAARANDSFPYGSVLVMETWRAKLDQAGNPELDGTGRFFRDQVTGLFVMRKEPGYGAAYEQNRTGEWEYVAYRTDRTVLTPPQNTASCAICHADTKGRNDWTFRTPLFFAKGSGAIPQGVILSYSFVPDVIRVRAGNTVTWYNADGPAHTVTAADGSFDSGRMLQDASFAYRFDTPGAYEYVCTLHAAMKGRVEVE